MAHFNFVISQNAKWGSYVINVFGVSGIECKIVYQIKSNQNMRTRKYCFTKKAPIM